MAKNPFLISSGEDEENDVDMQNTNNNNNNARNRNRNYNDNNQNRNNRNIRIDDNKDNNSESTSPNTKKKRKYGRKKKEEMTEEKKQEIQEKVKMTMAKQVNAMIEYKVNEWNRENVEDDDEDLKLKPTKEFIFGLTELIYDTAVVIGNDLESFRKHRNKKTVGVEDFMLFCRRNEDMREKMVQHFTEMQLNNNR